MLFCNSRGQCFASLVKLMIVAVYSVFPYFWCSTVDSIQFWMACCTAVSCRWRYITNFSLAHLLLQSCPKRLPANTRRIFVLWGGGVVLPSSTVHCAPNFKDMMDCTFLYCITISFVILPPIILRFPVDINPYPTAFPYGNGMVLHFYQQQESSMTKTVHKVINKGLQTYV
jgi:hypothetical protein